MTEQNGIDYLIAQHREVEDLLDAVHNAPPEQRQESFDALRRLLAVHETAEELILRPLTRVSVDGGGTIADARMAEENQAKEVLAGLEKLDVDTEEFMTTFDAFAGDVRQHAHNEEEFEFPLVREQESPDLLAKLQVALERAELAAPTHPHPSARSTKANLVLGPFAAIVDRVKDAMSSH
jgi:hemerythrin superfamily protein